MVTDERRQCKRANVDRGHVHKSLDLNGPSAGGDLQNPARASTVNNYLAVVHNFVRCAIYKRKLVAGSHPAATGRQAELDRLPERSPPVPSIYPGQINAIIEVVPRHHDRQIVNLLVFICEGGSRFQELRFLQVGEINLNEREIILDVKKPGQQRVRPELRKRCLVAAGLCLPKSRAARRPIHITDRTARSIAKMGLGKPSDWLFVNEAGNQVVENDTLQRHRAKGKAA